MSKPGYFNSVLKDTGVPIQATITVYLAGTLTLATIYSDAAGLILKDNPFQSDVLGRFQFFAAADLYDLEISGTGITTYTIENLAVGCPASEMPTGINAANIANGAVSNTEFQYLDGVTSGIQAQINAKWTLGTLGVANGGTGLATLAAGYIPFGAAESPFGSDAHLFWNNTTKRLSIGGDPAPVYDVVIVGAATNVGIYRFSDDTTSPIIRFFKSRGSFAVPASIATGDILGGVYAYGRIDDSGGGSPGNFSGGNFRFRSDAAAGVGFLPTRMEIYLSRAGAAAEVFRFNPGGTFWITSADAAATPVAASGPLKMFGHYKSLGDDAIITLHTPTTNGFGFISCNDGTTYAYFQVSAAGTFTLSLNSADVVANADTDGKLCLGIAAPDASFSVKNRLGTPKVINLLYCRN